MDLKSFDPRYMGLDADFIRNPYPTYHALRKSDPIRLCPDGSYFLTRHADLIEVYKDTKRFSSDKTVEFKPKFGDSPLYEHHTTSLIFNDPPLHTFVRRIIVGALTPRAIANMEGALVDLVDRLLDDMAAKGEVDLIEDFAAAIPIEVIGNLLDVPHADRGPLRDWSLAILGGLEPTVTPEAAEWGNRSVTEFCAYLKELIADRRANLGDPATDVLTRLIEGQNGETLSEQELLHNCIFILNAGHETTTNLIGNALEVLRHWPEEKARLIDDPSLTASAVEEVLRFESSNQLGNRRVVEPTTVGGVDMPVGTLLTLCIGGANRDPAEFPDPDRLDVSRSPNRHVSFASGPHVCAGISLARLEGKVAIERFLARFPDYQIIDERIKRSPRVRFRGFLELPAVISSKAASKETSV
ncbi:MAG: cytochrome P450 [Pseudomonadota bacterium]